MSAVPWQCCVDGNVTVGMAGMVGTRALVTIHRLCGMCPHGLNMA